MRMRIILSLIAFSFTIISLAQNGTGQLAATLEVLEPGVEVLRIDTVNWINVNVEGIVGVGDTIRTDDTGRARITFFADGTDTEILPNSEYRITQFEGDDESFTLIAEVVIGQTTQRLSRLLDANSTYDIITPGMTLAARGTEFKIRVERTGRSAMLVSEGMVNADNDAGSADVPVEFGIRAAVAGDLSDVVRASNFATLDSSIDGCTASVTTQDDVRLNVRIGPDIAFSRVGTIDPAEVDRFIGVTASGGWYRIHFRDGFGWILSSNATIQSSCAGLREFPDDHGPEDVSLYSSVGDAFELDEIATPTQAESD